MQASCGRVCQRLVLSSLCSLLLFVSAAWAAPDRFALVVGEAAYQSLPREPGCAVSAEVVAGRLRALGFAVAAHTDASNGEISAALIDLAHHAGSVTQPTVVIYFCGHTVGFDGRIFLLPVGAGLARPSDALTEGLPAQSLLDIAGRKTRAALTVFDAYDMSPAQPAAAAWAGFLKGRTLSPGHLVLAANETATVTTATPLARSLSAALAKPPVDLDQVATAVRAALAQGGITLAAAGQGGGAALVAAAAVPPPKAAAPKPAPSSPSPAPPPAPAAAAAAPGLSLPDEAHYSVLDRRRVQAALRLLGYYNDAVDGVFGPQTRAAIQHYQHDVGVPATGTLTPAEATALVAGLPRAGR